MRSVYSHDLVRVVVINPFTEEEALLRLRLDPGISLFTALSRQYPNRARWEIFDILPAVPVFANYDDNADLIDYTEVELEPEDLRLEVIEFPLEEWEIDVLTSR